jgi:hypothetical protein
LVFLSHSTKCNFGCHWFFSRHCKECPWLYNCFFVVQQLIWEMAKPVNDTLNRCGLSTQKYSDYFNICSIKIRPRKQTSGEEVWTWLYCAQQCLPLYSILFWGTGENNSLTVQNQKKLQFQVRIHR